MKVLISGSSGLIGHALSERLKKEGHTIEALPRTYEAPIDFSGVDAVVHRAGESIAAGRWTPEKKQRIRDSRIQGTTQLAGQIARHLPYRRGSTGFSFPNGGYPRARNNNY